MHLTLKLPVTNDFEEKGLLIMYMEQGLAQKSYLANKHKIKGFSLLAFKTFF